MIWIVFVLLSAGMILYFSKYISHKNNFINSIQQPLKQISLLNNKHLNLDESMALIEDARLLTVVLVDKKYHYFVSYKLKPFIHELLGIILKIPRLDENSSNITEALEHIDNIRTCSLELQEFFKENINIFQKYLK